MKKQKSQDDSSIYNLHAICTKEDKSNYLLTKTGKYIMFHVSDFKVKKIKEGPLERFYE